MAFYYVQFRRAGELQWQTLRNSRTGEPVAYAERAAAESASATVRGFKVGEIVTRITETRPATADTGEWKWT